MPLLRLEGDFSGHQGGFSPISPPFPFFLIFVVLFFGIFVCYVLVFETGSHYLPLASQELNTQVKLSWSSLLHWLLKVRDTVLSLHSRHDLGVWTSRMLSPLLVLGCSPVPCTAKLEDTFLKEKSNSELILFFQFKFKITIYWLNFLDFYTLSFCSYMEYNIFIHIHTDRNLDFILVFNRVIISFRIRMLILLLTVTMAAVLHFFTILLSHRICRQNIAF